MSIPAQWRLDPPPSRKAVGIGEVEKPASGLPLILAYPAGDQRIWIPDFVLYGHRIETVQLEGMTAPVPCVTVADAAGWEAAGYGYSAPTRLCPIDWAFTYIDQGGRPGTARRGGHAATHIDAQICAGSWLFARSIRAVSDVL